MFRDVAANDDDSIILAGTTAGSWSAAHKGQYDMVAVKLDSDGEVVWNWQVISYRHRLPSERASCEDLILPPSPC